MMLWDLIREGGPVMIAIIVAALVAMYVFIERWFQLHHDQINVRELWRGLVNVLKRDGFVEAVSLCDNTPGPAARVMSAAILAYQRGEEDLATVVQEAKLEELPRLERNLTLLGTIGFIAPLLGLLGTVLGMMDAFQAMKATETVYLSGPQLAESINQALITTAAGLTLAIPCYLGYNYLVTRVNSMLEDIDKSSLEVLHFFEERRAGRNKSVMTEKVSK